VAILLVVLIALVELVGLLLGFSASGAIDSQLPDLDADADFGGHASPLHADVHAPDGVSPGPLSQVLSWLCVGRVPVLVLLIVFFCAFGVAGFLVQMVADGIFGFSLPAVL